MRRSCVITHPVVVNDGKPFEALIASPSFDTNDGTLSMIYFENGVQTVEILKEGLDDKEGSLLCVLLEWQLAQALNPPIKVTQAVLDAMEKVPEAKFRVCDDYDNLVDCRYYSKWRARVVDGAYLPVGAWLYTKVEEYSPSFDKKELAVGDYIQADCPLALQVLLDFNEEGENYA